MSSGIPSRELETGLWNQGYAMVAGIDEVGRGPLAGPVVCAAVVLPQACELPGVRDSKLMSKRMRQKAATMIRLAALEIGIGWSTPAEIDELGLTSAIRLAAERALVQTPHHDCVLLDGSYNYLANHYVPVTTSIKADQHSLAVAAASVVAKVARDNYMQLLATLYPVYGFASNMGYGSKQHMDALRSNGATPHHRMSFKPVQLYADDQH